MDEDDKVRRNLVVTSAAVVLVWFLEVPITRYMAEAVKDSSWSPPGWRVWLSVWLLLLYLGLRYRFSDKHEELRNVMFGTFETAARDTSINLLARALLKGSRPTDSGIDFNSVDATVAGSAQARLFPSLKLRVDSVTSNSRERYSGTVDLGLVSEQGTFRTTQRVRYCLRGRMKAYCACLAFFHSWIYSRPAVSHLFPALIGAAAMLVASCRLGAALYAHL